MKFFNKERKEVTFKALDILKIGGEKGLFVTKQ